MFPLPLDLHLSSANGEFWQEVGGRKLNEVKASSDLVPFLSGLEGPSI